MVKGIALCGAHRVGKTTLAKNIAKELGMQFIPSQASEVLKRLNFDPKGTWGAERRLEAQIEMLVHHAVLWDEISEKGEPWITDRSPVDFIAYTLNDAVNWDDSAYEKFCSYLKDCLEVAESYFKCTALVQPDGVIFDGDNPDKGRGSRVLQECMNFSMRGVLESFFPASQFFVVFGDNPATKHAFLLENMKNFLNRGGL